MRYLIAAAVAAASIAVAGCSGSSGPDLAACKAAMTADYNRAIASPAAPAATAPAACKGASRAQLTRIAGEIASAALSPSPSPS
jgi:hypothetical protein